MRQVVVFLLLWVGFAVGFGAMAGSNLPTYFSVRDRGQSTIGNVTGRYPKNHDSVEVEYSVGGTRYRTTNSFVASPNPSKDWLTVGSPITVFYLPDRPSVATLGDPRALLPNELDSVIVGSLLLSLFAATVAFSIWRNPKQLLRARPHQSS